jgi:hypothetical protein
MYAQKNPSKTHEIIYYFYPSGESPEDVRAIFLSFEEPSLIFPTTEEGKNAYIQSKVFGFLAGRSEVVSDWENYLELIINWLLYSQRKWRWYGMWDYGDMIVTFRASEKKWTVPSLRTGWTHGTEVGGNEALLRAYVRTGKREYFKAGAAFSRHILDVDTMLNGLGTRHSPIHSGRGAEVCHTMHRGIFTYYWLTGDLRAWEVVCKLVETIRTPGRLLKGNIRSYMQMVYALQSYWETTGKEEDRVWVKNTLDYFIDQQTVNGAFAIGDSEECNYWERKDMNPEAVPDRKVNDYHFYGFGGPGSFIGYYNLTGDEKVANSFCLHAKVRAGMGEVGVQRGWTNPFRAFAFAYRITGDERYLEAIEKERRKFLYHRPRKLTFLDMEVEDYIEEFKKIQQWPSSDPSRHMGHSVSVPDRLLKMPYAIYVLEKIRGIEKTRVSKGKAILAYPNPFNPECYIPLNTKEKMPNVKCKIYNILGQLVREIKISNLKSQISKSVYWDGKDSRSREVSAGVYFYEMAGENVRRIVVLR